MGSLGKCSGRTIRHIVRLRQMLRRWRERACGGKGSSRGIVAVPADVPAGHVAVCVVGPSCSRRFVVRTAHLNHPLFRKLLVRAEEEYGFDHSGPLAIPCDEDAFEDLLRRLASAGGVGGTATDDRNCHAAWQSQQHESWPLLRGVTAGEWESSSSSSVW